MTTDKTPATLAEPRSHRWNDVGERCLDCGDKDWKGGPCSGPRLEATGTPWVTISTAPNDGRPHIRGLWVTSRIEGKPDTREWRQFIGLINDDGDFVDPDYGETFGWDADQYDAWMPVADAPSATLATAKHGGCVQLGDAPLRVFSAGRWTYDGTGQTFSHEDMDAAAFVVYRDAALSAQPSPGGQGARRNAAYDAIDRFLRNNMDDAAYAVYLEHLEALWAEVAPPKKRPYRANFPGPAPDSFPGYAAPPAQAVDLGEIPDGWRLSKKATCYQLSHGNDIIGNLVGPDAEANAAIIARVLDSQAVGNGN